MFKKAFFFFCALLAVVAVQQFGWVHRTPDTRTWIEKAVDREFSLYERKGISLEAIESAWQTLQKYPEYRRYKIINARVYGKPGKIKNLLQLLADTGPVPNVDFIYFNEDRIKKSFVKKRSVFKRPVPVLVSAKDASLAQFILFSDWLYDPTEKDGGWNAEIQVINEGQAKWPWVSKINKLFWRGSAFDGKHFGMYTFQNWTEIPRGQLVFQSRKYPEIIDAAFSAYPDRCLAEDPARCLREMGPANYTSVSDQLAYKYHLLVDGVTCTFPGTRWRLLSGSVPFKQDSPDIMYFYPELVAWKHYIPVRRDLSNLRERIHWAQEHDREAREIAENARNFALTHLMPEHILSYCRAVLTRYAALQRFDPSAGESEMN